MTQRYSAAVVGAGFGGGLSLEAISASPRFELTAVADLSQPALDRVREKYPDARCFTDAKQMFAQCPTDVVCVSTYAPSHLPLTEAALAGIDPAKLKGLVVEKPLADSTQAGRTLLDAVGRRNLPLVVPHGLLVSPHGQAIIERVRAGEIGELRLVDIRNKGWDIINAGIHWLNFFIALTDPDSPASVLAACDSSTQVHRDGMQVETQAVTYIVNQSGLRAVMHTGEIPGTGYEAKDCVIRITASQGTIELFGWDNRYRLVNHQYPEGTQFTAEDDGRSNHQRHLELLATQIDQGRPDYAVARSAWGALELCEAAYASSKQRCTVSLPLADFTPPPASSWEPGKPYRP